MEQSHGKEPGNWYLYITALHWSVTQFTPASMEVTPKNLWERLYNLTVIFISLVLFPTFISSISNRVSAYRKRNIDFLDAKNDLFKFLQENRVSLDLSSRIQSVVIAQHIKQSKASLIHEPTVSLLKLLPRSLKEEMHAEIYQPVITMHPFFKELESQHEVTLVKICDMAMSQQSLGPGEELFAYGKEAEQVYFLVSGSLVYSEGPSPSQDISAELSKGAWCCDHVLWVRWQHRGQMMSPQQHCRLANLSASSFLTIVGKSIFVRSMCARFAECYLAAITDDMQDGSCNDLGCSVQKLDGIVRTMSYSHPEEFSSDGQDSSE